MYDLALKIHPKAQIHNNKGKDLNYFWGVAL